MPVTTKHFLLLLHMLFSKPTVTVHSVTGILHCVLSCLRPRSEAMFRGKRQVHDHLKNTCPLLLVADHRFFKYMGREEESTTLNYLVSPGPMVSQSPQ